MQARLDFYKAEPAILQALIGVENQLAKGTLDILIKELVRLRASQMAAGYADIDTRSEILGIISQVVVNESTKIVVHRRGTMAAARGRRAAR